jgi:hypothetical protein
VKRTYVDAGVLIVAARGTDSAALKASTILNDPKRSFTASIFLKLEVLPKAIYFKQQDEADFYQAFFAEAHHWADSLNEVTQVAHQIAQENGLSAIDALHIAAAIATGAEEFITTEKPGKPMYRVSGIKVIALQFVGKTNGNGD